MVNQHIEYRFCVRHNAQCFYMDELTVNIVGAVGAEMSGTEDIGAA